MQGVDVREEIVIIPTYEIGKADKNPIFLEKRVYQGSCGKIYPYPTIDKISNEKKDKEYKAVFLENEYIRVMILPELGGRIQRAFDKTNNYDFVYYNQVIKPALVGLTGPWISGGIEFNWPQHHRPTTFMPVDYVLRENEDGSKTVLVNDIDQMYGTKGIAAFTLYPDKAYIEIRGQLYNRTPLPQTFLWWANPAVAVNEYTQSIFPPDVHAVMDHGKRDVSSFPMAKGTYYKHDYGEGVDISRYKNIPVPTSYMAEKSDYDFVGGYDHKLRAGILHVADHHISPGKKQWTWGNGDFGKAWDRNLTDEDGPYIELMTGVYTDNQPDFTWLKPFEEKTFKQYFMPYKAVGNVKNATIDAAVNMELREGKVYVCVYTTAMHTDGRIVISKNGKIIYRKETILSPVDIFEEQIDVTCENDTELQVQVYAGDKVLVSFSPIKAKEMPMPKPAEAAKDPTDIATNEELFLTGQHIEQYRHATYAPDTYYREGLRRDSGDIRINNAYGCLFLRRGDFKTAEKYFRIAIIRLTWRNPNPYDSEVYYNLGLCLLYQGKEVEAYEAFFKATWSNEQQEMSYYFLAAIACRRKEYADAYEFINKSLIKNSHNIKARGLKAYVLRQIGRNKECSKCINENLQVDLFDYLSAFERVFLNEDENVKEDVKEKEKEKEKESTIGQLELLIRNQVETYLQIARDYAEFGAYEEATVVLRRCTQKQPMLRYYEAYYTSLSGNPAIAMELIESAEKYPSDYCFPNKLEDILVLEHTITYYNNAAKAYYYLGNLFYDKLQYERATRLWEQSTRLDNTFPTVYRNLALSYYNKFHLEQDAKECMETAFKLDRSDSRIFLELDQLYKKLGVNCEERLNNYEKNRELFEDRDDLYIEYITFHNMLGRYEEAYNLINRRHFHPWEGGEGKITAQYKTSLLEMAKGNLNAGEYSKAIDWLSKALIYPDNLGEGKLEGAKENDIYYYLGCAYEKLKESAKAYECFEKAIAGNGEPAGVMYYNDQPADMILYQGLALLKLGQKEAAVNKFNNLLTYGKQHMNDEMRIEYFAVSLPDFLIFEDNLNIRNQAFCHYLIGLGNMGLGNNEEAKKAFVNTLKLDINHECLKFIGGGISVKTNGIDKLL